MTQQQPNLKTVKITDAFWSARQRLITNVAIPYMERILRDEIPGAPQSHAIANFRIAAGQEKGEFYGMVFQDSDVAKWLEAASYSLVLQPNPELEARMDELIDTISKAQDKNGYLNTYFTLCEPEKRWTNLLECHELYCAGHMMEAGAAHYEATGKTNLLAVTEKLADHIIDCFGPGKRDGIPGHQEVEIGLMRLYHATGKARYRDMAKRFLDLRGQDPAYFQKNTPSHEGIQYGGYPVDPADTVYNQTDLPVRFQDRPRGHAVRCLYMLVAMADVAMACQDEEMACACRRMFDRIVNRQMYVTGALGAAAWHESFTIDWHLPPDLVYGETCASVAMTFFSKNMLLMDPDGRYADAMERELYNGALAGMQLDGQRYFYVNPLEADASVAGVVPGYEHILTKRPAWHGCACCPPNLARLIASLGKYLWSEKENTIYSHLLAGSQADLTLAQITLDTGYPLKGEATYRVRPKKTEPFALAIHIPGYLRGEFELRLNGRLMEGTLKKGYVWIRRAWQDGDAVTLRFSISPRRIYGNPKVKDCAGRVALARGPLIYCFESVDQGEFPLHTLLLPDDAELKELDCPDMRLGGVRMLTAAGYRETGDDALYGEQPPCLEKSTLTAIPYYAWANRGAESMTVWIRRC